MSVCAVSAILFSSIIRRRIGAVANGVRAWLGIRKAATMWLVWESWCVAACTSTADVPAITTAISFRLWALCQQRKTLQFRSEMDSSSALSRLFMLWIGINGAWRVYFFFPHYPHHAFCLHPPPPPSPFSPVQKVCSLASCMVSVLRQLIYFLVDNSQASTMGSLLTYHCQVMNPSQITFLMNTSI